MPTPIRQDENNQFAWEAILTDFDDAGNLLSKFYFFDNGTTRSETYEAGVLREKIQTDYGSDLAPDGAKSWERIDMHYDANGDLEDSYQLNDNGIQILQSYEAGVLRLKTEVDIISDAAAWEFRYSYYDAAGQLERRTETRDDGVEIVTEYENGVRRFQEQIDLDPMGGPSDARKWERFETRFDPNGDLESRYRLDDDGVQTVTQYENGVRRFTEQVDADPFGGTSDARIWERIDTLYDAEGQVEFKFEARNNGDATAYFFEDGNRVARYGLDGDGSETWTSREILYGPDGSVLETNYDVLGDQPGF